MDLWIRSQNNYGLMKPDTIGIEKTNGGYKIWAYKTTTKICLGEYRTEERALEVLDEIEHQLVILSNSSLNLYQMPKE